MDDMNHIFNKARESQTSVSQQGCTGTSDGRTHYSKILCDSADLAAARGKHWRTMEQEGKAWWDVISTPQWTETPA